jgi:hypothetical protein
METINKPAAEVTDDEVSALVESLRCDPRVSTIGAEPRRSDGTTAIYIRSSELEGVYSYGRVSSSHSLTPEQIEIRKCESRIRELRAQQTVREERFQDLLRREANTERLNGAGFTTRHIDEAWRTMCSGRYLDPDSTAGKASSWHRINVSTNYKLRDHYVV